MKMKNKMSHFEEDTKQFVHIFNILLKKEVITVYCTQLFKRL